VLAGFAVRVAKCGGVQLSPQFTHSNNNNTTLEKEERRRREKICSRQKLKTTTRSAHCVYCLQAQDGGPAQLPTPSSQPTGGSIIDHGHRRQRRERHERLAGLPRAQRRAAIRPRRLGRRIRRQVLWDM
jgi:hypothetical protein